MISRRYAHVSITYTVQSHPISICKTLKVAKNMSNISTPARPPPWKGLAHWVPTERLLPTIKKLFCMLLPCSTVICACYAMHLSLWASLDRLSLRVPSLQMHNMCIPPRDHWKFRFWALCWSLLRLNNFRDSLISQIVQARHCLVPTLYFSGFHIRKIGSDCTLYVRLSYF